VACIWKPNDKKQKEVIVASAYLDINDPDVISRSLTKLVNYSRRRRLELILCADTNAHSTLWNSQDTNNRGEAIEEFILANNLNVCNIGNHCTFFNRRAETIIDVTLSTNGIREHISNWRVDTTVVCSDHHFIRFDIQVKAQKFCVTRDLKNGDWTRFQDLTSKRFYSPEFWSEETIEDETEVLLVDILRILDVTHPLFQAQQQCSTLKWWNAELQNLHKEIKKAYSRYRLHKTDHNYELLTICRRAFSKATRRAKRASWKEFCNDSKDMLKASKLCKIIRAKERVALGLIKSENGEMLSPEDSINKLLDVHFPGSESTTESSITETNKAKIKIDDESFFSCEKTYLAINSFGDFKAAGPDGLKPKILKNLGDGMIFRLTNIYKACFLLGYVPVSWRTSKVVFIPKEGKSDYSECRSFRPITLSNFLFKVMERLMQWKLDSESPIKSLISTNQHAFIKGRSTETALSNLVKHIEGALTNGHLALGVFLDIQGAFDNVRPDTIIAGLTKRNIDDKWIKWYSHYLYNRTAVFEYNGVEGKRELHLGTPQGGVLSPLMWNIVFEDLLKEFENNSRVAICGYADDAALIVTGTNLMHMRYLMQLAIDKAVEWSHNAGLTFSKTKTLAMIFSKKRNVVLPPNLEMEGTDIQYTNAVQYLGVTLDSKLTWKAHIKQKIFSAKALLLKICNAMGSLWGMPPRQMHWAYTGMVRPAISYGSVVWSKVTELKMIQKDLTKVNRLALCTLGSFRKSTPTAGLEIICNVEPLHLHIKKHALMTLDRIQRSGVLINKAKIVLPHSNKGHRQFLREMAAEYQFNFIAICDEGNDEIQWAKPEYIVDMDSFKSGTPETNTKFDIYTDGSLIKGQTGSGLFLNYHHDNPESCFHLRSGTTVFQAEIYAIKKAAE